MQTLRHLSVSSFLVASMAFSPLAEPRSITPGGNSCGPEMPGCEVPKVDLACDNLGGTANWVDRPSDWCWGIGTSSRFNGTVPLWRSIQSGENNEYFTFTYLPDGRVKLVFKRDIKRPVELMLDLFVFPVDARAQFAYGWCGGFAKSDELMLDFNSLSGVPSAYVLAVWVRLGEFEQPDPSRVGGWRSPEVVNCPGAVPAYGTPDAARP